MMTRNLRLFLGGLAIVVALFAIACTQNYSDANSPNGKQGSAQQANEAESSRIALSVKQQFDKDQTLSPFKIDVDVSDGVVSLRGRVPTQQAADRAEQVAEQVDGVRTVHSYLKVGDDEKPS